MGSSYWSTASKAEIAEYHKELKKEEDKKLAKISDERKRVAAKIVMIGGKRML